MIIHCLLFLFQWKYMRENLFLCRVYICKLAKQEGRGGEHSPPLILYMEKEKAKKDVLGEGLPIYDCIDFADISFSS